MGLLKERGFEFVSKLEFNKSFKGFNTEYKELKIPKRATKKSAGYDFFAPFDITLLPNQDMIIPTGIKAYMLDDEVLKIYPRSGLGFKFYARPANLIPIIDADYYDNPKNEGNIMVKIRNESDQILTVAKGKGFCQGIFQKYLLTDGDNHLTGETRISGIDSTNQ